jgi:hypothetical protein
MLGEAQSVYDDSTLLSSNRDYPSQDEPPNSFVRIMENFMRPERFWGLTIYNVCSSI